MTGLKTHLISNALNKKSYGSRYRQLMMVGSSDPA